MSLFHIFILLALAVWMYMTVWFMVARFTARSDVIDSAWGLGFIFVAWIAWAGNGKSVGIKLLAAEFVTLWGLRLFLHIFTRNIHKNEDHRYEAYRHKWGRWFWPQAYFKLFLLQGLLLLVISTTTVAIMTATHTMWLWLAVVGFVVWAVGMIIEAEADAELRKFIRTKKPNEIMTTGLWRYSRHPNYFGEIASWCGAALVAISLGQWWGIIGTLVIAFLIIRVSGVPPLEKHYASNKAYQKYRKHTSVLVPWLPR